MSGLMPCGDLDAGCLAHYRWPSTEPLSPRLGIAGIGRELNCAAVIYDRIFQTPRPNILLAQLSAVALDSDRCRLP